jgi:phosphotriesterase-related protein
VSDLARFIRTVLGDIDPSHLGVCYAHEHLIIDPSFTTFLTPDFQIDDVNVCTAELREALAAGARAMVDSMPMACGRNVLKLAEVARRSSVHVLCPTGLHLAKYYPPGHWSGRIGVDELALLFVREINDGIDANDCNGPTWIGSGHRAGLIKIASGLDRIDEHERKVFTAAAIAHRLTGAPILTHTEQGTAAIEQIELLHAFGVDLTHVVLSHADRRPDPAYHREILSSGVRVEYDSCFRWKGTANPTLDLLAELMPEFPDQIMLGTDAARRSYWKHYGGKPGLAFLIGPFVEQMREREISNDLIRRAFVTTPAHAYQFTEPKGTIP